MSRRQSRVSTGTTVSRSGWSFSRAYSRASTIHARWMPGRARRSARATGSAWMTSPSDESLTMAIFGRRQPCCGPGSTRRARRPAEAGEDGGDQVLRRVRLRIARDGDLGAHRLHRAALGHVLLGVVGALGVDVGAEARDQRVGAVLLEDDHRVHPAHRGDQLRPLRGGHHRAARALQPPHRGVGVEPDHERVAERAGGLEIADVADVEEIEAAVGEHQPLARRAPAGREAARLVNAEDGRHRSPARPAARPPSPSRCPAS